MARAPKVTWERIKNLISAGYGSGFGEQYQPLLQIKRWNPSPVSVQVLKPVPPFARNCHFFSHSEWFLALLFSWVGAHIREQYPLWPWTHQHPMYGLDKIADASLTWSKGMQEICRLAGIKHGCFIGTTIPYIWTIDLALTLPWVSDLSRGCCLVSVKPLQSEEYLYPDPLHRGQEKLEAERRYAQSLGINYLVGDRTLFQGPLFGQLEWLSSAATLPTQHRLHTALHGYLDAHGDDLPHYPLDEFNQRLQMDYGLAKKDADYLLLHVLWQQIVDCDISKPIKFSEKPRPGGKSLISAIRKNLQGDRS